MSGAHMAAGAEHDPANRDYTQIVFAENIIAVIRVVAQRPITVICGLVILRAFRAWNPVADNTYAALCRPVPGESWRNPDPSLP